MPNLANSGNEEALDPVYLYILIRADARSMNESPGLVAAQATHGANQCVFELDRGNACHVSQLSNWQRETGAGFGTCIVLSVPTGDEMIKIVQRANALGVHAGVTHDPTFPLRDGGVLHLVPFDTCAYVFGSKNMTMEMLVGHLKLY